jgi:hypothetical protein
MWMLKHPKHSAPSRPGHLPHFVFTTGGSKVYGEYVKSHGQSCRNAVSLSERNRKGRVKWHAAMPVQFDPGRPVFFRQNKHGLLRVHRTAEPRQWRQLVPGPFRPSEASPHPKAVQQWQQW